MGIKGFKEIDLQNVNIAVVEWLELIYVVEKTSKKREKNVKNTALMFEVILIH